MCRVDTEDKIKAFLPTLDEMMSSGLVTLEKVQVLQYGALRQARARPTATPERQVARGLISIIVALAGSGNRVREVCGEGPWPR